MNDEAKAELKKRFQEIWGQLRFVPEIDAFVLAAEEVFDRYLEKDVNMVVEANAECEELRSENKRLRAAYDHGESCRLRLETTLKEVIAERDKIHADLYEITAFRNAPIAELNHLKENPNTAVWDSLIDERDKLRAKVEVLTGQRDGSQEAVDKALLERDQARMLCDKMMAFIGALASEWRDR